VKRWQVAVAVVVRVRSRPPGYPNARSRSRRSWNSSTIVLQLMASR